MKKVLFVIPTLGEGGAERVLVTLVNYLDKSKYETTILTIFDVGINKKFVSPEVKYLTCFPRIFRGNIHLMKLLSPAQLFKLFIKDDYDIIVSYLEGPTSRIVSGCPKGKAKIISWVHIEIDSIKRITQSYRSKQEAIRSYQKFDATVFVSETVKSTFLDKFPQISRNLRVIYNTVNSNSIRELSNQEVDDISFDHSVLNLVSVGRFTEQKGYDRLLIVVNKLVKEGFKIRLYLIGKGELLRKYQDYISDNLLSDYVKILGFLENPYKYVRKCDLFVCSSYREGYSTAVTESLIVGTPVVTTECSGMLELLGTNNEFGLITNNSTDGLYQGIKSLAIDRSRLEYYKGKALERGSQFSQNETVLSVERLFDDMEER